MPKYRIAETLRVEFIIESDAPNKAVDTYMHEFIKMFTADKTIQVQEGTEFTINLVNQDGTLGYEVDPEATTSDLDHPTP
jgi:hypothetical protein